jgi:DNA-binding transcriptional regulator YdaS (Cro superfamily)
MTPNELIEALGGTAAVATLCGVKQPSVSGWKDAKRIPDDKLIRLAPVAEARGIVTRKELFPKDYAAIWPELGDAPAEKTEEQGA